ncbi:MAG TPA: hypothetical protein VJI70_02640 [Candidatus Paceibacterota bacterium]
MIRISLLAFLLLLLPTSSYAARAPASFSAARSVLAASSSPGNAYDAGFSVVRTASVAGDLSVFGGSIITAAPVSGDELLLAGSIKSRARVGGDLRVVGGSINIEEAVAGDLVAFGFSVHDSGRAGGSVFIVAANTTLSAGAAGPVTIYGNNISIAGDFASNVNIVASGRITLVASTTIAGKLSYEAPEEATIPVSATIRGGIEYTSASYLPDAGTSRILAVISIGFFLFVRILGALILAGLLAGLFPRLAEAIVERAVTSRPSKILLTILLGFAAFVVTPVLFLLLALTFVGFGLALLLFVSYIFVVLFAIIYAGILLGGLFARRYMHRDSVLWHDGVLGMLALSLIALVPYVGIFIAALFTTFSAGALLLVFFHFAFPHEDHTPELL